MRSRTTIRWRVGVHRAAKGELCIELLILERDKVNLGDIKKVSVNDEKRRSLKSKLRETSIGCLEP